MGEKRVGSAGALRSSHSGWLGWGSWTRESGSRRGRARRLSPGRSRLLWFWLRVSWLVGLEEGRGRTADD